MKLEQINAGYVPLMDSALLVATEGKGFAADEGLALNLVRENSWANIRDRLVVGQFDVAHMLAPMPIASNLALNPINVPMIAPMALGLGGNAVTVSKALWAEMAAAGAGTDLDAARVGAALKKTIGARGAGEKLRFAVVHPYSGHNYELRYWLAACGIQPDKDVELVIVPPPLMPDALAAGTIDGFCVGAPWSTIAVTRGLGRIVTIKAAIWRSSPEKVLGMTVKWAEEKADVLSALLRAVHRAAQWCGAPENTDELAALLSSDQYLGLPQDVLVRGLSGNLMLETGDERRFDDFFVPFAGAANFPWQSHALWFYAQMVRWGQVGHSADNAARAAQSYRPDLYRVALADEGASLPAANAKVEGALTESTPVGTTNGVLHLGPDGFFDGEIFDPDDIDRYIIAQNPNHIA